MHGFSASFASTSEHSTQTGKGLSSGPKLVNPSDRYSVEYFLRTIFFVFRDSLSEDSLVAFDSSAFLFPPTSHRSIVQFLCDIRLSFIISAICIGLNMQIGGVKYVQVVNIV